MRFNQDGLNLIKSFEGCKLTAYKDVGGIWTVGYGFVGSTIKEGTTLTQAEADKMLNERIDTFSTGVIHTLHVHGVTDDHINDNQFSALVCFSYNVGLGNLIKSTLLKKVAALNFSDAANEFLKWDKVNGVVVLGLHRRRQAERDLFLKAVV
jgi:lysozyme